MANKGLVNIVASAPNAQPRRWETEMKTKEQKIHDYEERLLKQEKSVRRSRNGAIGFVFLFFLSHILYSMSEAQHSMRDDRVSRMLVGCIILSIILAYQYGLQTRHIDSIKLFRSQTSNKKEDSQQPPY